MKSEESSDESGGRAGDGTVPWACLETLCGLC